MKWILLAALASSPTSAAAPDEVPREITCYSGGREIFHGFSDPTAPVYLGAQDDHVLFHDRDTGLLTRVGGNCIVRWLTTPAR